MGNWFTDGVKKGIGAPGQVVGWVGKGIGEGMGADRIGAGEDLADRQIQGNRTPGDLEGQGRRREMLLRGSNYVKDREGAQAGRSAFRANQRQQIGRLTDLAEGRGPSLARQQAQDSLQRGVSTQQALAAGARPGQAGMAARQASQQGSMLAGSVAGASAQARAQEQLGALGQLSGTIQGARAQDQGLAGMNLTAEMNQRQLNDAQQRAFLEMELRNAQLAQQGQLEQGQLRNQLITGALQTPTPGEAGFGALTGGLQAALSG